MVAYNYDRSSIKNCSPPKPHSFRSDCALKFSIAHNYAQNASKHSLSQNGTKTKLHTNYNMHSTAQYNIPA